MHEPKNHHYVPRWLLSAWCSPIDLLLQSYFRLPSSKLSSQRKAPKSVAVQQDLYSWVSRNHTNPNELEKTFFQELDNNAARAAEILREPGTKPMPLPVRRQWARFLTATAIRTPDAINGWTSQFREMVEQRLGTNIVKTSILLPNLITDTALEQIIEFLSSDEAVEMWMDMQWFVEKTDGATYHLLTSDCPCVGRYLWGTERKMVFYPLAPNRLFCATDDPFIAHLIVSGPRDFCVNWSNNLQIKHARRYLFGTDDLLKWHIEKYFGEGYPDPPLPDNIRST